MSELVETLFATIGFLAVIFAVSFAITAGIKVALIFIERIK